MLMATVQVSKKKKKKKKKRHGNWHHKALDSIPSTKKGVGV
jgi:hypothetical protein